ncbi:MAG TPA: sodium:solute symporter, partial [Spirochaetia bacterium]|nr:sodium:solute symporter [Spirochaetia bacterium]
IVFGLFTRWFHRWGLLAGWAAGMVTGTWMAILNQFKGSVFALHFGSSVVPAYAAVWALIANLIVTVVVTFVLNALKVSNGADQTAEGDYRVDPATT